MSSTSEEKTEKVHDYSQKSIDAFKLIFVNPPPNLTDQGNCSIATSFESSSQDKIIENNTKIILTHVLKRCNENRLGAHPSTHLLKL